MPHSNGRIYRDTSTTPTKGIDIGGDIAPVLGRATTDLGQLCKDVDKDGNPVNSINPDALYKPYEYEGPSIPNFANGGPGVPGGTFGYVIPTAGTGESIMGVYNLMWSFRQPTTFFRALDFDNYDHAPRYDESSWGMWLTETSTTITGTISWGGPERFVCPYRMRPLFTNCYMAFAIFASYNTGGVDGWEFRFSQCCESKISEVGSWSFSINKSDVDVTPVRRGNVVTVVPFISNSYFATTTNIMDHLSTKKWNINYKYAQYRNLMDVTPDPSTVGPFSIYITRAATYYSGGPTGPYRIIISGEIVNNTSANITGEFYPLYRFWGDKYGQGTMLYDGWPYDESRATSAPEFNDTLLPNETRAWQMELAGNTGTDLSNVKSITLKMKNVISSLSDTGIVTINVDE